jgi:hypothetical protein
MRIRQFGTCSVFLLAFGLCSMGCLEHEVRTTINTDGSCERVITFKTSSREVPATPFPLPMDGSWDTTWAPAEGKTGGYVLTIKKHFGSFEDLEKEYSGEQPEKINVGVRVQSRFRWFFTYFEYRESYGRFTSYTLIPPTAVMTEDEIERYTYGDTSDAIKNKKDEWVARNLYELIHRALVEGTEKISDSTLTPALIAAHKDELFRILTGITQPRGKLVPPEENLALAAYHASLDTFHDKDTLTEAGLDAFLDILNDQYRSPATERLREPLRSGWKAAVKLSQSEMEHGEKFRSTVVMPGILLATNAKAVEGTTAEWDFDIDRLAMHAYEMRVESRVVNVWAIGVTAVLVLGILAVLAIPMFRVKARVARV